MSDPISVVGLLCEAMAEQGKDVKAQVNHQDNFGQTPLHRAALRGSTICSLNLIQVGKKESLVLAEICGCDVQNFTNLGSFLFFPLRAILY